LNKVYTDQIGSKIEVPNNPKRIVSLVPSQTEFLFDLGLDNELVGITKFCVHPQERVKEKIIIGGTKNFRFETIDKLNPDLIIANKEENYKEGIDRLSNTYPVWTSDIYDLKSAYRMMHSIGSMTNKLDEANLIIKNIQQSFQEKLNFRQLKAVYLIWKNPILTAGVDTFINSVLKEIGLTNVISRNRYPEIDANQLRHLNPDVIMLSSEPFPFKEEHIIEFQEICPRSKVILVDGEIFSWYGSRLLQANTYFKKLEDIFFD